MMHFKAVKKSRKGSVFFFLRGGEVFTAVKGDAKFESMNVKGVLFTIPAGSLLSILRSDWLSYY